MKLRYTFPIASTLVITIFTWVATAKSQEAQFEEGETPSQRMESREKLISERTGMPASMDQSVDGEDGFIAVAVESGWIIEATLDEVEAAMNAAKATPSTEDDIAAKRMAHRGSYRFFLDEVSTSGQRTINR